MVSTRLALVLVFITSLILVGCGSDSSGLSDSPAGSDGGFGFGTINGGTATVVDVLPASGGAKPDLTVLNVNSPSNPPLGSRSSISTRVGNLGPGIAAMGTPFEVHYMARGSSTIIGYGSLPRIDPGEEVRVTVPVTITGSVGEEIVLCFEIDPSDRIEEEDETNNQAGQTVTIAPSADG